MKHLMKYTNYTPNERTDDILDKISKYGISSLTQLERDFLNSYKSGREQEYHDKLSKSEADSVFEDDRGYFKFEFESCEDYGDEIHYLGTLYVPDIILQNGQKVEGRLEGRIIVYESGSVSPDFYSIEKDPKTRDHYDVFEFCNGLEYELDSFIDYVVTKLENKE